MAVSNLQKTTFEHYGFIMLKTIENKHKKVVIVGNGEFAMIAYDYFTHDSDLEVVAFAGERHTLKEDTFMDLPNVPLEDLEQHYPPNEYGTFVAVSYVKLNRLRKRLFEVVKSKGYTCVSYISSHAFVWHNVEVGENCFIFENNVVQFHVKMGDNIILWSGNHIGHRTVIKDHTYIASHVVISGFCEIGQHCFLGINASFNDEITIGDDVVLGNGCIVVGNLEGGKVYVGNPAKALSKSSYEVFKLEEDER